MDTRSSARANLTGDNIYIFAGPTLARGIASQFPDYVFLPPASCGDILTLLKKQTVTSIGLIDGYFGWCRAVFHKEILYAIDHGVKVMGGASMGALRASELDRFGMIGVGEIYESFRDGIFEDDDEVAITHAPEEFGYLPITDALVDIRDRLKDGLERNVLTGKQAATLLDYGKSLHFSDRTWALLFAHAEEKGMNLTNFKVYLSQTEFSAKERDAIRLLEAIRKIGELPKKTLFDYGCTFENTSYWQRLEKHV